MIKCCSIFLSLYTFILKYLSRAWDLYQGVYKYTGGYIEVWSGVWDL